MNQYKVKYKVFLTDMIPDMFPYMKCKYRKRGNMFWKSIDMSPIDSYSESILQKERDSFYDYEFESASVRIKNLVSFINSTMDGGINKYMDSMAEHLVRSDIRMKCNENNTNELLVKFVTKGWHRLDVGLSDVKNDT